MGLAISCFCFFLVFSRFLPLLGQDPNKNLEKTNKNKHSNVSALVPAGLEVLFFFGLLIFFAAFGRRQKEPLRAFLAVFDRYLQQIEANSLTWWSTAHPSKMAKKMASLETILAGCTTIGQRWRMTCFRIGDSQSTEDFSCSHTIPWFLFVLFSSWCSEWSVGEGRWFTIYYLRTLGSPSERGLSPTRQQEYA